MELSDFQRRMLGFPADMFSALSPGADAPQEQQDLASARWNSLGQIGNALLAASGRMTDGQRTALLAQGLSNVQDPQRAAMNAAQMRIMQSLQQARLADVQRQEALRQKLTDPATLQALGVSAEQAQYLGEDGIRKLLENQALANTPEARLDRQFKQAQIDHLMRPEKTVSPTPQMVDLPGGGKGWVTPGSTDVVPIAGAGKGTSEEPKKTEAEVKGYQFAQQSIDAYKKLADPEYQYALTSRAQQLANNIPYFSSPWSSNDYRSAEAASSAMTDAILRNKSGATIHDPEIQDEIRRVIPSPGDTPAQIADKVSRQRAMIEGFIGAANPADRAALRQMFDQANQSLLQKYSGNNLPKGVRSIEEVR